MHVKSSKCNGAAEEGDILSCWWLFVIGSGFTEEVAFQQCLDGFTRGLF
jgi:hypothetical protein